MAKLSQTFFVMIVAALAVCRLALADEGPIYVNVNATADECDGSSWSKGFKTWNEALKALNARPDGANRTMLLARGRYSVISDSSTSTNNYVYGTGFVIRGGYRAASDGDMERDVDQYATIIANTDVNKLKWTHVLVDPETGAKSTESTTCKVFVDNVFQPLPAYTGRYDFYYNSSSSGVKPLTIAKYASGTVDGLYFVGFTRGSSANGVVEYKSGCGENWISNCTFTCCNIQGGALAENGGTGSYRHVSRCRFIGTTFCYGGTSAIGSSGNTIVEDTLFTGCIPLGNQGLGPVVSMGEQGSVLRRCVFTRNGSFPYNNQNTATTLVGGNALIEDCAFSNNVGVAHTGTYAPMMIYLAKQKNTSTTQLKGCLFTDNASFFTMNPGTTYVFLGAYSTTYDNAPVVENCTFFSNRLVAVENTLQAGQQAQMGLVGNSTDKNMHLAVVGCSFVSNSMEWASCPADATVLASRGVLLGSTAAQTSQAGVANCSFLGPNDGTYDFVQYGSPTEPSILLNSVFSCEDVNAVLSPIHTDSPLYLKVVDCTVGNLYPEFQPTEGYAAWSGVAYDPVPLKPVAASSFAWALQPQVKTPDARLSADLSPNAARTATSPATFAYRLRGAAAWQPLVPKLGTGVSAAGGAISDAAGTVRTQGATTRGALQTHAATAETGANLVLRRAPVSAGTLSAPANQAVAAGAAITPVSVDSSVAFAGWYMANDTLYSSANPLEIANLSEDLVLTAKFQTETVDVTFDLGEHATFDATGEHTCTVSQSAGSAMPEIPAFTVDSGWHFVDWPGLPSVVPEDDATYTARIVTRDVRTLYVAPVASGTGDGSSWENATDDFVAAYDDAGLWRGVVRVKGGCYRLTGEIELKSNVSVVGEAGETVILSGDISSDDYWLANNTTGQERGPVWTGNVFNPPNPDWADAYWAAKSPTADNTQQAFVNTPPNAATNVLFRNVTFTGFSKSVLSISTADTGNLAFENCRFLANGTARAEGVSAISLSKSTVLALKDCELTGNYKCLGCAFDADGGTNEISGCTFSGNSGCCLAYSFSALGTSHFTVTNSVFTRNWNAGTVFLSISSTKHSPFSLVSDCTISENRTTEGMIFVNGSNSNAGGNDYWPEPVLQVERCAFVGNRRTTESGGGLIYSDTARYYWANYLHCRFADNVYTNTSTGTAALFHHASYQQPCLIGCAFENNEVVATHASGAATLFLMETGYTSWKMFGLSCAGNRIVSATPGKAAVFTNGASSPSYGITVMSSVIDEDETLPLVRVPSTASSVNFTMCALTGRDASEGLYSVAPTYTECSFGSARVLSRAETGANGVTMRRLSGSTPCRWTAMPFWVQTNGKRIYRYYSKGAASNSKFVAIGSGTSSSAQAAKGYGVGLDIPPHPDAFGAVRKYRVFTDETYGSDPRVAPGPLNAADLGFLLLVR